MPCYNTLYIYLAKETAMKTREDAVEFVTAVAEVI